ncbi:MAG: hypothetical protein CL912_22310 [Deltaproteobacteria bacterium]|nr:hypothetical protein [Deltaproteobacteria bacterium]
MAWFLLIPCFIDRDALEDSCDSGRDGEESDNGEERENCNAIEALGHDPEVEEKDGGLVHGDGHFVGYLENPMELD